jgi:protein-disulfide isomerase
MAVLLAGSFFGVAAPQAPSASVMDGPVKGGPVNMIVFQDFQCPYSKDLFFTIERLEHRYGPNLHVIFKQSPLPIHPDAPLAHRAALAAGLQGKMEPMSELLYANQNRQDRASLMVYARRLHLDMARFVRDLDSPAVAARLKADLDESRAFGVEETPSYYLDGKALVGTHSEANLASYIDQSAARLDAVARQREDDTPEVAGQLDAALSEAILNNASAVRGPVDAPLTIVEFTDFQCPFCKSAITPMEQLIASRGREVRWVLHSFPLDFHADSELAHEAALAAGDQGKFWEMHDLLFANQSALKIDDLRRYAHMLSLDVPRFDRALSTHQFAGQVAADRALGAKADVNATPTFFVDGHKLEGARQLPELLQLADSKSTSRPVSAAASAVVVAGAALPDQQVLGAGNAPVTITWYTDVRSSLAARQAALLQSLATQYGTRLRVLYRAFAVETHPDSVLAAQALVAAMAQKQFWAMYRGLSEHTGELDRTQILTIATQLGLDATAFAAELDRAQATVQLDRDDAARRGILGAPVMFVNGTRMDGMQADKNYTAAMDAELKTHPATTAALTAPGNR